MGSHLPAQRKHICCFKNISKNEKQNQISSCYPTITARPYICMILYGTEKGIVRIYFENVSKMGKK